MSQTVGVKFRIIVDDNALEELKLETNIELKRISELPQEEQKTNLEILQKRVEATCGQIIRLEPEPVENA